jgi:Uma2 family endonuclease
VITPARNENVGWALPTTALLRWAKPTPHFESPGSADHAEKEFVQPRSENTNLGPMSLTKEQPALKSTPSRFMHGDDFLRRLGDIPISRVVFNPGPGTATESDLHEVNDRGQSLYELVDGTLVEKPLGYEEGLIALAIATALRVFVRRHKLGIVNGPDATIRMSSGSIRVPDVSFVSADDLPGRKRPRKRAPRLPPTLAVEVISTGNSKAEMRRKSREYFESGARLVWLVYPRTKTVAVFDSPTETPRQILTIKDTLSGEGIVPGFSLTVTEVFDISDFE